MKNIILLIFIFFQFVNIELKAQELLTRRPSLSPDGSTVAFSYQGDIWTMPIAGSNPTRLTLHQGYETHPVWSPNGDQIAFTSGRFGNNDVFTIPSQGGRPTQLTYYAGSDQVSDWSTTGNILFTTNRAYRQIEWDNEVYTVSENGGTPQRLLGAVGDMPSVSPNGRFVAFVRGSCRTSREAYKGPSDREVWLFDNQNKTYKAVTDNQTNDFQPKWGDNQTLYFISNSNGRYNVVAQKIDDEGYPQGTPTNITSYRDNGIRHFDISAGKMVFTKDLNMYSMDLGSKKVSKMTITIATDYRFDPITSKTFRNGITEYALSPNGKLTALVIRGEVYVKQNDKEKSRTVNLSKHPYRDQDIAWLNDSTLLFVSDRSGNNELYMVASADSRNTDIYKSIKHKITQLTNTKEQESNPIISPNGEKIVFIKGKGGLEVADIDANGKLTNQKTLLNGWDIPKGITWSPDSKWLAYGLSDLNFNNEIYIHPADNSRQPVNVSMHPRGDYNPTWSRDGSKLAFTSNRINDHDVWFVWLKQEDWEKTKADHDEGYYFDEEKQKKDTTVQPIRIDFERIHQRLVQVTSLAGNENNIVISKDGETFYYTAKSLTSKKSDLYSVKWNGEDSKQLTSGGANLSSTTFDSDGEKIYALSEGKHLVIDASSGSKTPLPHIAKIRINHAIENEQIFEEAWRALSAGFYDPEFHGINWLQLKKKYKPWTLSASTTQDFRYMYNLMLGQLNASHMGLYGGNPESTQKLTAGKLGIEVEPTKKGVKINHIVAGTPADKEKSKLYVGETILSVDGNPITPKTNFYSLLLGEKNQWVLLEVQDKAGKKREVVIRPTSSISTQLYEEWITEKKKLTDKYSNGKLGYIHIRGMNMISFERFERELMASGYGKDGVVIDVRFNGGGWTTDYLMAVLNVKQHAYTIPRGAAQSLSENPKFKNYYPFSERLPLSSWTKPSVALCNQSSYSNAEIFSHAYKHLGIGTLVGMPTFGAVISTSGRKLIDGSLVRMPFRAWYVKATGQNMENGPAVPDVLVENKPGEKSKKIDTQLKKAVEILLKEI